MNQVAHFNNWQHRVMPHIIWNASFESNSVEKGNDILTYDEKGAWGKKVWEPPV